MKGIDTEVLAELQANHFRDMVSAGWANPSLSNDHYLALIISEVGEAIHAHQSEKMYNGKISEKILIARARYIISAEQKNCISKKTSNVDITDEYLFKKGFEIYAKDTFQDELADVLLRCLNLMSLRSISFRYIPSIVRFCKRMIKMKNIPECAYDIISSLTRPGVSIEKRLDISVHYVIVLSECLNIDILNHAEMKRKYNMLRTDWPKKKYN